MNQTSRQLSKYNFKNKGPAAAFFLNKCSCHKEQYLQSDVASPQRPSSSWPNIISFWSGSHVNVVVLFALSYTLSSMVGHSQWIHLIACLVFPSYLQFGSNQLLGVHYDAISDEEAFYNGQGRRLLSVKYKSGLLPTQWSLGLEQPNCSQTFDR